MPSFEFIYKTEIRVTETENKQGFQGRKGISWETEIDIYTVLHIK